MVARDDHPGGVGHPAAHLGEPPVRPSEHRRHEVAVRVQRGTPGVRGLLGREGLAQRRTDLLPRPGPPRRRTAVRQEQDRPYDAVPQRVAVAVGMVAGRAGDAVVTPLVAHERDRVGVGAKGGPGQRNPPGRGLEGLLDGVAPGQGVAGVVHLVEHDEGATPLGASPVQQRVRRDAGVGEHHSVEVGAGAAHRVAEPRVEHDAHPGGGVGPLGLQVLGRCHDGDRLHGAAGQQLAGDAQGEGGLTGTRGRDRQEIAGVAPQVGHQRSALPGAQRRCSRGFGGWRGHGGAALPGCGGAASEGKGGQRGTSRSLGERPDSRASRHPRHRSAASDRQTAGSPGVIAQTLGKTGASTNFGAPSREGAPPR